MEIGSISTQFVPLSRMSIVPDSSMGTFAMPAVDAGNVDVTVQNGSSCMAWMAFGAGTNAGPYDSTCLRVPSRSRVLVTSNPAVLAASAANPLVQTVQGGAYATATVFTAMVQQRGGALVVSRGTAAAAVLF